MKPTTTLKTWYFLDVLEGLQKTNYCWAVAGQAVALHHTEHTYICTYITLSALYGLQTLEPTEVRRLTATFQGSVPCTSTETLPLFKCEDVEARI